MVMVLESCLAVSEQGVQVGTKRGRCVVAHPYHLGAARKEVQDQVAEGGV